MVPKSSAKNRYGSLVTEKKVAKELAKTAEYAHSAPYM